MENTTEDQSINNNELLKKFLLVVKQYYLSPDVAGKILEYSSIDLGIVQNQLSLIREWVKIQKDLSRNQDGYPIVQKLQEIELKYYKPIIYKLIDKEDSTSLEDLQQLFEDLANLSSSIGDYIKGSDISALKYYSDAAIFYQYQYSIKQKIASEEKAHIDYKNLNNLKQKMLTFINRAGETITQDIATEIEENKTKLVEIRSKTKRALTEIDRLADENDNKNYIAESEALFLSIASDMKSFLNHLHEEAKKEIRLESPCKYALIGLGSMALNQMTPYSDIEFAILTENNDYKKDPTTRDYFRNLSHLIHFKVINLGETIIPTSRYGLDISHLVNPGVNFDLGGKTPLGRIDGDKPYDLIKTVEEMMWYVKNEDNKSEHIDKNLPFILEKVTYITGNEEPGKEKLVKDYKNLVKDFLQQPNADNPTLKNHQFRALKVLKEGSVEFNYLCQNSNQILAKKIPGDLERLNPSLNYTTGELFNVKQEIYRLPDRLIYGLGMYFNEIGGSIWNNISRLKKAKIINLDASHNLKYAATFATTLRLKTYLHNKGQKECMSLFSLNTESLNKIFHLDISDLNENGALFKYFYTALSLYKNLKIFCESCIKLDNQSQNNFFDKVIFYENNSSNKGLIYYRLLNYQEAQKYLEIAINEPNNEQNINIRNVLGAIYYTYGDSTRALEQFSYISETKDFNTLYNRALVYYSTGEHDNSIALFKEVLGVVANDEIKVKILTNIGNNYLEQREYHNARDYYYKVLTISKDIYIQKSHYSIAGCYINLGLVSRDLGEYQNALQYLKHGFAIESLFYKNEPHPNSTKTLINIALVYHDLGDYEESVYAYKRAIDMLDILYKDCHPRTAIAKSNLGVVYLCIGEAELALTLFQEALEMRQHLFENNHPCIAESYLNLGNAYIMLKHYKDAESVLNIANEFCTTSTTRASIHSSYGNCFLNQGKYKDAEKYLLESLKMQQEIYHPNHYKVCNDLRKLGYLYKQKKDYPEALYYLNQSLDKYKVLYQGQEHLDIAKIELMLGAIYYEQQDYQKAKEKFEKGLEIETILCKVHVHYKHLQQCHFNLANVYLNLDKYELSSFHYNKSLEILDITGDSKKDVLFNWEVLCRTTGNTFFKEGEFTKAENCYLQSVELRKKLYESDNHPAIALSLNKLALTYAGMNNYKKALEHNYEAFFMACNFNDDTKYIILNDTKGVVFGFAEHYGFNKKKLYDQISNSTCCNPFINYKLHYDKATLLQQNSANMQDIIYEYKLACILAPENSELKLQIYSNIADLMSINYEEVETCLFGEIETTIFSSQELI